MERIFIGVGSNIDPASNILKGLGLLGQALRIRNISTFYLSEPKDRPKQPSFYNGVLRVETSLEPADLKHTLLRRIESDLGRKRTRDPSAPRTIDLDLLLYGDRVISTEQITIPDPEIPDFPHLAVPLCELAKDLVLPDSGMALKEAASAFRLHAMKPLLEFTDELKKALGC